MNRKYRISIAAILAIVLVLTAAGAWAAPKFQGTVPPGPQFGDTASGNSTTPINFGTVTVSTKCAACTMTATVMDPALLAAPPTGKVILSTTINLVVTGAGPFTISYPYPAAFADKGAKIYKLNTSVTPNVWVEVPGGVLNADGTFSVDVTEGGIYTLMGNT